MIGGCLLLGMALVTDARGTVKFVVAIITVRGVAWICTKITSINKDASEIINMTGWCAAVVPLVGLVKLAIKGVPEAMEQYAQVLDGFKRFAAWIEKLTFWS
jgi:glycine cleavage system regulatory protein